VFDAGKNSDARAILVLSDGKNHWSYAEDEDTTFSFDCEPAGSWKELKTLEVHGLANVGGNEKEITFVEGEPVILRESDHDNWVISEVDWEKASHHDEERENHKHRNFGIVMALPPGSRWVKSWKVPTFVAFGAKNLSGPKDADLAARAVDLGAAGIQIVVDVTDDKFVPTPANGDARALVRSDHVELWWTRFDKHEIRQLGIGMRADGSVDVRWLMPENSAEKTPAVRRTGAHFEIDLSMATLGVTDPKDDDLTLNFTAAFSDADDPTGGQQTIVATSPVRRADDDTFGELRRLPTKARRFPLFGDPMY